MKAISLHEWPQEGEFMVQLLVMYVYFNTEDNDLQDA